MKKSKGMKGAVVAMALVAFATSAVSATDEQECLSGRAKAKGKYEKCVAKFLAKFYAGTGSFFNVQDVERLAKCRIKYAEAWSKLQGLGTTCAVTSRYTDSGDGTVTDSLTGLVWEKKSDNGDVHDKDSTLSWSTGSPPYNGNGTAFTSFLAVAPTSLNEVGFAGANDWRLPTFAELQTILLPEPYPCSTNPCVDSAFNSSCTTGCDVTTCSCTFSNASQSNYWSATTNALVPSSAWGVDFIDGGVFSVSKTGALVRAVRGGL